MWGADAPASAIGTLRAYVANLRRALEPGRTPRAETVLTSSPLGYRLRVESGQLDALRFRQLVASAASARAHGRHLDALNDLDRALELWTGPAFGEFADASFAATAAAELEELRLAAQEERAEAELAAGRTARAAAGLRLLVAAEPLRERRWEMLALALYRSGRQAEALAALREARRILVADLGIEPRPTLRRLEQAILNQDVDLDLARTGPESADPGPAVSLAGREDVLRALQQSLSSASAGRGRLFLVTGEPGIGKTGVTEAAASTAAERGFTVVLGRCPDGEGTSALWPWVSVLRTLLDKGGPTLRELAAKSGLGALLDVGRVADRAQQLHTAIAEVVAAAARLRPLLVVLDDLHWADLDTVRVLRVLTTMLPELPLLVVAASRDGADLAGPVAGLVAQLTGWWATRWPLRRLTEHEVELVLAGQPGAAEHPDAARVIHRRSGGNPFHVVELARLLPKVGPVSLAEALPHGTRDLIQHRLGRLPGKVEHILLAAAVIGEEFEAAVLADVCGLSEDALWEAMEAALQWGLVTEGRAVGRYRFSHALVRDTLRAAVSQLRLARWHARIAAALAKYVPHTPPMARTTCCRRWRSTGWPRPRVGHAEEAIDAGRLAADRAVRMHAHAHAATLLAAVIDTIDRYAVPRSAADTARLLDLLVRLGRTSCRAGLHEQATAALGRAIRLARELDDVQTLAVAATTYSAESFWSMREYRATDRAVVDALREALRQLPPDDSALRCLCLAAVAAEQYFEVGPDGREPDRPSAAAVAMARRIADPDLLLRALHLRHQAIRHPDTLTERHEIVREQVELAATAGVTSDWAPRVLLRRALTWLEAGDMAAAQADIDACAVANERTQLVEVEVHLSWWTAMREGLAGRTQTAVRLSRKAYDLHHQTVWGDQPALTAQLVSWQLDQGRYQEAEAALRGHQDLASPVSAEHLGLVSALQGKLAQAREQCPPAGRLPEPPPDWLWLMQMAVRAYTWALCGDAESSRHALERLLPYSGRTVTTGSAILCWGSIDHFLGASAAAAGDMTLAISLLQKAVRHNGEMGCLLWQERSQAKLAELAAY
ncbi:ATP-binding protein [Fodinicola feengrottensis]|uniref:ATP-binding protein n=1 Tax=Fodinicola feengrottensis TaxID=435914 RepID=UPI0013D8480C|nr:BTAD domain-containing putative transcriptional regulator [Fodinicola feengrottensis]